MNYNVKQIEDAPLYELWALTLMKPESAVLELMERYPNIHELNQATMEELKTIRGIGNTKAVQIKAILELGTRIASHPPTKKRSISSPKDVANFLMPRLRFLDKEHFIILLLNTKNQVLKTETVSIGILNQSLVHPREVFKLATKNSAAAIIFVHNHPSGDPNPSSEDIALTRRLNQAGELMGISVLDHVIIGDGSYISMKERGLL